MKITCGKCAGAGFIPCKACKGTGDDKSEISGVCNACGGPGRFPCWDCDQSGQIEKKKGA
jgi:hypothetical protein